MGYVFPLEEKKAFVNVVEKYSGMRELETNAIAEKALKYAIKNSNEKVKNSEYRTLFNALTR